MSDGKTTIKVPPKTRDKLRAAKIGNETYSDVILRLLDAYQAEDAEAVPR